MIEQYYTAKDVQRLFKVSKAQSYTWLAQMETLRIGGTLRVSEAELERFIARHRARGMNLDVIMASR